MLVRRVWVILVSGGVVLGVGSPASSKSFRRQSLNCSPNPFLPHHLLIVKAMGNNSSSADSAISSSNWGNLFQAVGVKILGFSCSHWRKIAITFSGSIVITPAIKKYNFVGAGFTNNNCLKSTISQTRPHPTKNHHLHFNIRCKFQVDVGYWWGGAGLSRLLVIVIYCL